MTRTQMKNLSPSQRKRITKGARALAWGGSKWIHPADRQAIYIRDGRMCLYCGARESVECKLSLDHLVPHELGGSDEVGNLITACCRCNFRKQDKSLGAFLAVLATEGVDIDAIGTAVQNAIVRPVDRSAGLVIVQAADRARREARKTRAAT